MTTTPLSITEVLDRPAAVSRGAITAIPCPETSEAAAAVTATASSENTSTRLAAEKGTSR